MPDWSYHPFFRPLLFRLPPAVARDVTLSSLGVLSSLPLGNAVIEMIGQMRIPAGLEICIGGLRFPGPVGLGAGLDVHSVASAALARFGFGFLEIGPVTLEPVRTTIPIERRVEDCSICYPDLPVNDGLARFVKKVAGIPPLSIPLGIRLAYRPQASAAEAASERCRLIEQLSPFADFFTLDICREVDDGMWSLAEWREHLCMVMQALQGGSKQIPLLCCLPADLSLERVDELLAPAVELGVKGVVAGCGIKAPPSRRIVGAPVRQHSLCMVHSIHDRWGDRLTIIGSGGVEEPGDALQLLEAGATLVQVHSGLVYSGPGLPKRINEAVAHVYPQPSSNSFARASSLIGILKPGWIWMAFVGIALLIGSILVGLVAVTRVVLPYDEAFVGITRGQIVAINPRLLPFMTHDRVTLAGTMLSIGILYFQLALHGVRNGARWAWWTIVISCAVGFASFFLFLGFGYFDPLHALLAIVLFIFFCLGLRRPSRQVRGGIGPSLNNDRWWLLSQWGQFLFIIVGAGLVIGGLVIATVGVTNVFVPEDLGFLHTMPHTLSAANARLIPLIAHDRAGFGGALVSDGLGIMLLALWGFRRGARWVWWTLAGAGVSEFLATVIVHLSVGYTNFWHLTPTMLAALPYALGLTLSYPYLCQERYSASSKTRHQSELQKQRDEVVRRIRWVGDDQQ